MPFFKHSNKLHLMTEEKAMRSLRHSWRQALAHERELGLSRLPKIQYVCT